MPDHRRDQREVMDIKEAADYLGICADTLYKYASEGTLPAFKLGNRWRFKRALLNAWMTDRSLDDANLSTAKETRHA